MRFHLGITVYFFLVSSSNLAFAGFSCGPNQHVSPLQRPMPNLELAQKSAQAIDSKKTEFEFDVKGDGKSSFQLKVNKISSAVQPSRGTVVYLCGGPEECMNDKFANVPANVDVVVFDHIGLGRNASPKLTPEQMSVDSEAMVVGQIVDKLKLKNYVIYGQSFGTTVAARATAMLSSQSKIEKPNAVILEGVIGSRNYMHSADGYARTAEKAWSLLNDSEKIAFKNAYKAVLSRIPAEKQDMLASNFFEHLWYGPKHMAEKLKQLPMHQMDYLAALDTPSSTTLDPGDQMEYLSAGCETMNENWPNNATSFFDGVVKNVMYKNGDTPKVCGCRTTSRNYDSKDFQINSIPILVIEGDFDPATPIEQADYFYAHQKSTPKHFLKVQNEGHFPTLMSLSSCVSQIYEAAFVGNWTRLPTDPSGYFRCPSSEASLADPRSTQ